MNTVRVERDSWRGVWVCNIGQVFIEKAYNTASEYLVSLNEQFLGKVYLPRGRMWATVFDCNGQHIMSVKAGIADGRLVPALESGAELLIERIAP